MEKVKLTQEQANIISSIGLDELGEWFYKDERTNTDMYAALKDFTMEEIAKAKIEGYEVEPEFKVGDWVITGAFGESHRGRALKIRRISKNYKITGISYCYFENTDELHYNCYLEDIDRQATPEEIAKEKQRIWWAKHDRGVWELREGDALKADDGDYLVEVCEVFDSCNVRLTGGITHVKVSELKEGYRVICFAEDRKDLGDD